MNALQLPASSGKVVLKFRIKVPGRALYEGLFVSSAAARADADQRFPDAPPASVLCLSRIENRRAR